MRLAKRSVLEKAGLRIIDFSKMNDCPENSEAIKKLFYNRWQEKKLKVWQRRTNSFRN